MGDLKWTDIDLWQHDTPLLDFTIELDGAIYNLTGATVDLYVKASQVAADPAPVPLTIQDPPTGGVASLAVTPDLTAAAGRRWYRLQVTSPGGQSAVVQAGYWVVRPA